MTKILSDKRFLEDNSAFFRMKLAKMLTSKGSVVHYKPSEDFYIGTTPGGDIVVAKSGVVLARLTYLRDNTFFLRHKKSFKFVDDIKKVFDGKYKVIAREEQRTLLGSGSRGEPVRSVDNTYLSMNKILVAPDGLYEKVSNIGSFMPVLKNATLNGCRLNLGAASLPEYTRLRKQLNDVYINLDSKGIYLMASEWVHKDGVSDKDKTSKYDRHKIQDILEYSAAMYFEHHNKNGRYRFLTVANIPVDKLLKYTGDLGPMIRKQLEDIPEKELILASSKKTPDINRLAYQYVRKGIRHFGIVPPSRYTKPVKDKKTRPERPPTTRSRAGIQAEMMGRAIPLESLSTNEMSDTRLRVDLAQHVARVENDLRRGGRAMSAQELNRYYSSTMNVWRGQQIVDPTEVRIQPQEGQNNNG